jgi:hypothetical protein
VRCALCLSIVVETKSPGFYVHNSFDCMTTNITVYGIPDTGFALPCVLTTRVAQELKLSYELLDLYWTSTRVRAFVLCFAWKELHGIPSDHR